MIVFLPLLIVTVFKGILCDVSKPEYRIGSSLPEHETWVKPGEFPYVVFVDNQCGGSLIKNQWVLTAAHCIDSKSSVVGFGSIYMNTLDEEYGLSFVHPGFNLDNIENDIALIKLNNPISHIKPVTLPKKGAKPLEVNDEVWTVGWGTYTQFMEPYLSSLIHSENEILRKVKIPIMPDSKCLNIMRRLIPRFNMSFRICAGDDTEVSCIGDSGGLIVKNDVQWGITSGGPADLDERCLYGGGTFWTSTLAYSEWIECVINNEGDPEQVAEQCAINYPPRDN